MFSRLPKIAVVAALACWLGLHWGMLQSIAWVGMVVNYSQETTVVAALDKTFNGEHPCALCKTVAAGKKAEKKSEFPGLGKKFEFSYAGVPFVFTAPSFFWLTADPLTDPPATGHTPPVPPPKSLLG